MSTKKERLAIDNLNKKAQKAIHQNPEEGLRLAEEALKKSDSLHYIKGSSEGTFNKGWCLIVRNNNEEAITVLEESLSLYKKRRDQTGIMKVLNAFGVLHTNISNYDTAIEYYLQSMEMSRKTGNNERLITVYINIGSLYTQLEKNEKALTYFNQAFELLEETPNPDQECGCLINTGEVFEKNGNLDEAGVKYSSALIIAKTQENSMYESNCLTSLGRIYQKQKDFIKAEEYHNQSLKISTRLNDQLGKVECLTNLAQLYRLKSEYKIAEDFYFRALTLSRSIHSVYFKTKNLLGISEVFQAAGDHVKALDYYKEYHENYSDMQNKKVESREKTLQDRYKVEAAKKESKVQKKRNKVLKDAFERISLLNEIGRNITSSLHIETVMTAIYENISRFLSVDLFGIGMLDNTTGEIDFKYLIKDGKRIRGHKRNVFGEKTLTRWVIENKSPLLNNNIQKEYKNYVPELVKMSNEKPNSLVFVPLSIRGTINGVITIQSYTPGAYTRQHLEIIQAIGSYSTIALENSRVHEEIYNLNKIIYKEKRELEQAYKKIDSLANHDTLTCLPNRRLFMELLKKEIINAGRQKTKMAVMFIDLDNFKNVNDTSGHDAGDEVLKIIARRFSSTLRKSDTIARIGGDEFAALILDIKNKKDVEKVSAKIIEKVANPVKVKNTAFDIGASIGISLYPEDDSTIDGLLKKADTAMYRIKSSGKNGFGFSTGSFTAQEKEKTS